MKQFLVLVVSSLLVASVHSNYAENKVTVRAERDFSVLQAVLATMPEALAKSNATFFDAIHSWSGNVSEAYSAVRSRYVNSGIDLSSFDAQVSRIAINWINRMEGEVQVILSTIQDFANSTRDNMVQAAIDMDNAATGPNKGICLKTYARMNKFGVTRYAQCVKRVIRRVESVGQKVAALFTAATPSDVAWINQIDICSQSTANSTCVSNYFQNGFRTKTLSMVESIYYADSGFIYKHLWRCVFLSRQDLIELVEKARSDFDNCLATGL